MRNKILLIILWLFVLLIWLLINSINQLKDIISSLSFIYFWISLGWIFLIILFKLRSNPTFIISFTLFFISGFLSTFNLQNLAENFMRISLIGWMIGFTQALVEYKKADT